MFGSGDIVIKWVDWIVVKLDGDHFVDGCVFMTIIIFSVITGQFSRNGL